MNHCSEGTQSNRERERERERRGGGVKVRVRLGTIKQANVK